MAKTLDEILKAGRLDPAAVREMQEQAKKAGLTKRVIHIELDLLTGNLKSNTTPMDHVMHLGMLEFYKATVLAQMLNKPISKDQPEPAPEPQPETPPDAPAPAAETPAPSSDVAPYPEGPGVAPEAAGPAAEPAPADAPAPEGGAPAA
jgi:hypothetical protein